MVIAGGYPDIRSGTKWIGERGWIWVDRGEIPYGADGPKNDEIGPEEVRLISSRDHFQNFFDSVRSRTMTRTLRNRSPLRDRRPPGSDRHGGRTENPLGPRQRPSSATLRLSGSWPMPTGNPGSFRCRIRGEGA